MTLACNDGAYLALTPALSLGEREKDICMTILSISPLAGQALCRAIDLI